MSQRQLREPLNVLKSGLKAWWLTFGTQNSCSQVHEKPLKALKLGADLVAHGSSGGQKALLLPTGHVTRPEGVAHWMSPASRLHLVPPCRSGSSFGKPFEALGPSERPAGGCELEV